MDFTYDEEQQALREAVRGLLATTYADHQTRRRTVAEEPGFDRALWGDIEIEFAVLDYCQISTPSFWEGYGIPRDESQSAQIRRIFYLLYELQKYMPIHIWRRNDPAGAARYKQQSLAMAAALTNR